MKELINRDWQKNIESDSNAIILDVRTDDECEEGMIAGALQIDILNPPSFMEKVQELDPTKNYYVYCRSGGRSAQACAVLSSIGISNTFNLIGGITNWDGSVEKKTII